jgi:hypothetical protein
VSYYQGDFYQGDLGGFFGKLWGAAKGLAGTALGFMPGGSVLGKVVSKLPGGARGVMEKALPIVKAGGRAIIKHPVLSAAGAAGAIGAAGLASRGLHGSLPGRGMHISKRTGHMVRNRRMNPCNGRALRRAIRRAHAFERLAKHVIGFSSPRKPRGHMYFKRKRKAK